MLAALSPIFSRILSTSPAPHVGQNRLLSLEAVGSHALLKLVGFLYSGEMEIESRSEHEEVMAAAHRLGLRNLLEKKRVWVDRGVVDVGSCWKETGVRTKDSVKSQESEIVSEPLKIQSSTASVTSVQPCGLLGPDLPPSQFLEEVRPNRGLNLISNATVPSLADMTEASISDHHKTKAKKRWKMAKRESQLKKLTRQQNQIKLHSLEMALKKKKAKLPSTLSPRPPSSKYAFWKASLISSSSGCSFPWIKIEVHLSRILSGAPFITSR